MWEVDTTCLITRNFFRQTDKGILINDLINLENTSVKSTEQRYNALD